MYRKKNSIRLEWNNPNQDLCTAFKIEKKTNNDAYSTLYSGTNMAEAYYNDTINPVISGTISYRVSFTKLTGVP
jgi:hypothetical protein